MHHQRRSSAFKLTMVKDYFQDITPPGSAPRPIPIQAKPSAVSTPAFRDVDIPDSRETHEMQEAAVQPPDRSIRNVTMPIRTKPRIDDGSFRTPSGSGGDGFASVGGFRKYWIWGAAGLSVFVLAGLSLFVFRATSVVVTPRAHTIVFDQSNHFVAAPAASAATGTIPYTVVVRDYDDTATVPAGAPTHVETRAQ